MAPEPILEYHTDEVTKHPIAEADLGAFRLNGLVIMRGFHSQQETAVPNNSHQNGCLLAFNTRFNHPYRRDETFEKVR